VARSKIGWYATVNWSSAPRSGAHVLVVDVGLVAAARLGAVHRGVGLAQHGLGVGVTPAGQREPDAGRHRVRTVADPERFAPGLTQPLGERQRVERVGEPVAQEHELVAAQSGHRVGRADHPGQALRKGAQQVVTGLVAVGVVDQLEVVEVEEHEGHGRAVAA
jgi:hypothetical protein